MWCLPQAAAKEINAAVEEGKKTEVAINIAREMYRKQATEGAMLYFLLTQLCYIDHMYQYSLDSFVFFFFKSIQKVRRLLLSHSSSVVQCIRRVHPFSHLHIPVRPLTLPPRSLPPPPFVFILPSQAAPADNEEARVANLRESLRMTIYTWVSRGLFERHKLIFLSQLTFNLMKRGILGTPIHY